MATSNKAPAKQNLTITLDRHTIQQARVIAARRSTSISGLVAQQIEALVGHEKAYQLAQRRAFELMDRGFHLGKVKRISRDELHER